MHPPGGSSEPPPPPLPPPAERVVDLLVDLPTEVLDKILTGLPTIDVARTSVLSKPWRHRWESVPGLDIDLHGVRDDAAAWGSAVRFLERCTGPVGRVSVRGVPLRFCRRADECVRAVAGKKPTSLSIVLPQESRLSKPLRSLFLCDAAELTELELRRCAIPAPPAGFAGFEKLTKLDLEAVLFTSPNAWPQLEAMVAAAAPTLVDLRLQNVVFRVACEACRAPTAHVPGRWVINAPNLRRLVLGLRITGAGRWELAPMPNLELARIYLSDSAEDRDYVQVFKAISNVRELHIGNFFMGTQVAAINIFQDLLERFKNLRILRLDGCFHEPAANQLFNLSPFLETIEIKRWY